MTTDTGNTSKTGPLTIRIVPMPGKKADAAQQQEIKKPLLGAQSGSFPAFSITPTLVADQVYEALRTAILTGELAGGSPVRVRDVAAMVGTSVMPVREAIRRLEETGLATRVAAHRGAVVREFTVDELIHIYEVRATLEIEAARRGAANVTDADVARMEAACARMQKAVTERRVWDALDDDEDLLRTLYSAGRNPGPDGRHRKSLASVPALQSHRRHGSNPARRRQSLDPTARHFGSRPGKGREGSH
ncbi:GntR family transcriptional regulator [Pseudarthrobacter sp. O4]|uniref:GntR family transcriptional regulator n=1 Tax=Pseudarthrobacter sp. O4 TaxID=3418417 RepID=UPI003CED92B4